MRTITDKQLSKLLRHTTTTVDCDVTGIDTEDLGMSFYANIQNDTQSLDDVELMLDYQQIALTLDQDEMIRIHLLDALIVSMDVIENNDNGGVFTSDDYAHFESLIYT